MSILDKFKLYYEYMPTKSEKLLAKFRRKFRKKNKENT